MTGLIEALRAGLLHGETNLSAFWGPAVFTGMLVLFATLTARRFLARYGNPYRAIGTDGDGRAAIEWGVYGVPETFVVGREGTILYKMVGPVTKANFETVLKVEIEKALKAGG